jgi:hypothetical protein
MLLRYITSKTLTIVLLVEWLISIIYSYFIIPPRVDDGYYLMPALSVANGYPPGIFFGEEFRSLFFILPTQPFINGLFLSLISLFGFEFDIYSYRLLNFIVTIIVLIFITFLLNDITKSHKYHNLTTNIFLIIISLTPFATNFYVNRPENMGLLLLFLAIYLVNRISFYKKNELSLMFSIGILIGITATIHPNFTLFSSIIFLIAGYKFFINDSTKKSRILMFSIGLILPITIFSSWILYNFEIASDQLLNRIDEISHPGSFISIPESFSVIFKNAFFLMEESWINKIYHSIFMLPFIISLALSILLIINIRKNDVVRPFYKKVLFSLVVGSIFLLIIMVPYPPYLSSISFIITLVSAIFISQKVVKLKQIKNNIILVPILFTLTILPLSPLITHSAKLKSTNNSYYNINRTSSVISNLILEDDIIIITSGQLLPPFIQIIDKQLKTKKIKLFWLFPAAQNPGKDFKLLFIKELNTVLSIENKSNTIWGNLKKGLNYSNDNQEVCIALKGNHYIKLINIDILFEDRDNIFFRPNSFTNYADINQCISSFKKII